MLFSSTMHGLLMVYRISKSIMLLEAVLLLLLTTVPSSLAQLRSISELFPSSGMCGFSAEEREEVLQRIQDAADDLARGEIRLIPECGDGLWYPVGNFDLNGGDTECPEGWTLITAPSVHVGCSREPADTGGCATASFDTGGLEYTRVCGRATGRAFGNPEAFFVSEATFVDGLTISYSDPPKHIWSFAADRIEDPGFIGCPCNSGTSPLNQTLVDKIGDRYFCECATPDPDDEFVSRAIWTGGDCGVTVSECCNINSPPYFRVTLPSNTPTTEDIDATICTDQGRFNEMVLVERLELFVAA